MPTEMFSKLLIANRGEIACRRTQPFTLPLAGRVGEGD